MASPYWRARERLFKAKFPAAQRAVLDYFIHRADFATGRCAPGFNTILAELRMGKRRFLDAREKLRQAGHLTWTQRKINSRQNDTTEYQLHGRWLVLNDPKGVGAKRPRKHTTRFDKPATPANDSGATHCTGCGKNIATDTASVSGFCRRCWAIEHTAVLPGGAGR